jgi:hypothetical protein
MNVPREACGEPGESVARSFFTQLTPSQKHQGRGHGNPEWWRRPWSVFYHDVAPF